MSTFDIGIATIFAREVFEGSIIIQQYRTVIKRSEDWQGERERQGLHTITVSAIASGSFALALCIAIGVALSLLNQEMDDKTAETIEGVSKVVASICILQLSLKLPEWFGVYPKKEKAVSEQDLGLTIREIRFNVAWNIWREVAECGVFLIPYFLADSLEAIPLSAVIGIVISLALSLLMVYANRTGSQRKVCISMTALCAMLAIGLFTGGIHEFELVAGETSDVWCIKGEFWDQNKFPMTMFYPFGYTACPTVVHIITLFSTMLFVFGLHYRKYVNEMRTKQTEMTAPVQNCSDHEIDEEADFVDDSIVIELPDNQNESNVAVEIEEGESDVEIYSKP